VRLIIDVSSTMDHPLTGVGWRTFYLVDHFLKLNSRWDVCLFAARSRKTPRGQFPFKEGHSKAVIVPYFRRLKTLLWPTWEFPPIEWFCGKADLVHGTFHDLPASRHALRLVTVHDLSFLLYPETHTPKTVAVQKRLMEHAVRHADAFEAVSESCKRDLMNVFHIAPEKIHVVPGGVHLEEWQNPFHEADLAALKRRLNITREYFIHLGTIEPRKNLPRLLEAYARIRERFHEYPQLVLAGAKGWKSELTLEVLAQHNFGEDVIVTGYIPRSDAVLLLRGAAACVYPSLYEGFGLPVLEAMAACVPVICSTASALREVSDGQCIFVDPLSVESIEAGLDLFLNKRDLAKKRAESAYQRARTYTWDSSAKKLAALYELLITRGKDTSE